MRTNRSRLGRSIASTALLLLGIWTGDATAQENSGDPETDMKSLLEMVRQGKTRESEQLREREARFRAALNDQERLLAEALARLAEVERASASLEGTYETNEVTIADLTERLDSRLGSLKELFGVLQQVTEDTRGLLESSVVSAQLKNREEALIELARTLDASSALPSIESIEHLWYLMQQEMIETGRVVAFSAPVISNDGREAEREVVRVGGFNVVSSGHYLRYTDETGRLSELGRQPQGRYTSTTEELVGATGETVVFGLDPTRGQILASYVDRPDLRERVRQGGFVGVVILILGGVALIVAIERLVRLAVAGRRVDAQLTQETPSSNNPLGRVLEVAEQHRNADVETLELKLGEAIFRERPRLTSALLFLKIIGVVAPLLGLLGTVTGMIVTFQSITLFGTGDPKIMAGGISQALVTTVLGLTVAIPTVLLHTLVSSRSRRILHVLQEQSAGIVAERSERGGGE